MAHVLPELGIIIWSGKKVCPIQVGTCVQAGWLIPFWRTVQKVGANIRTPGNDGWIVPVEFSTRFGIICQMDDGAQFEIGTSRECRQYIRKSLTLPAVRLEEGHIVARISVKSPQDDDEPVEEVYDLWLYNTPGVRDEVRRISP